MLIRKAIFVTTDDTRVCEWMNTESDFPIRGDEVILITDAYSVVSRRWLDAYNVRIRVERMS